MTPEKYARTESERMEGAKTAQSKTVYKANEPRGYPSGKCQRETAKEVSTKKKPKKGKEMYGKIFLRVADVMEILGVSNYAYKLIRKLNKEMQEMGFQTIQGRIDTKFFYEHFLSNQGLRKEECLMPVYKNEKNGTWYAMIRYKVGPEQISRNVREDFQQGKKLLSGKHSLSFSRQLISI